jgi:ABC-type dipeptide/oligopeptide/nickel transport system ATPase component
MSLLTVERLTIDIGGTRAVSHVSFALERGERVGLIGESGSGKSMTALALIGLLPDEARAGGRVEFDGRDILRLSDRECARLRGDRIGMIFQEPMTALNPTMRVGRQVAEVLELHDRPGDVHELLRRVEFRDPERIAASYPHQLSGGQRQRILCAVATACSPALVLADEPTTALDVTVQAQVLALLGRLVAEEDAALLLISHDLAVVGGMCERLLVMYRGELVEQGPAETLLSDPQHPYTKGLLATATALDGAQRGSLLPTISDFVAVA